METQLLNSKLSTLKNQVEALLFTADSPLSAGEICSWLEDLPLADVRMALRALSFDYEGRAFELVEADNKYQLRTRPEYLSVIKKQYGQNARSLTKNALETLAIVAYRQPVTRAEINALRQLDSASILQTLQDKELIYAAGIRKQVGNPIEYKTTSKFLEVFGITSLQELPSLRSLQLNIDQQKQAADALQSFTALPQESSTVEGLL